MSIMYGTLLRKYESIKDDFGVLSKRYDSLDLLLSSLSVLRYDDMMTSHSAAVAKLEHSQVGEVIREQF